MRRTSLAALATLTVVAACDLPGKYTKTGEDHVVFGDKVYPVSEFRLKPDQTAGNAPPVYFDVLVNGQTARCGGSTKASCAMTVKEVLAEANRGMGY